MKITLLLFSFLLSLNSFGYSFRRCTLLPITDNLDNVVSIKVFKEVEQYLKEEAWCDYQSNSAMMSVFSKYRKNLKSYLDLPGVIRTVSEKLKVGSIIRANIKITDKGAEVNLDILGENGGDLFLSEKTIQQDVKNEVLMGQTIKNWLEIYEESIPYDGLVTGVIGDQITIAVSSTFGIDKGQTFKVKRMMNKKKHPLLKKIVSYTAPKIAEGRIYNISNNLVFGKISIYMQEKGIKKGDWVSLDPISFSQKVERKSLEDDHYDWGKLGEIYIGPMLDISTYTAVFNSPNEIGGLLPGIKVEAELWMTRHYFGVFRFSKNFGDLEEESGSINEPVISISETQFKLYGGYRYLPLGFFYGPQIDGYIGFAKTIHTMTRSDADGYADHSYSGIIIGLKGSMPLLKKYRIFARADIAPFPGFSNEGAFYPTGNSASMSQFELGTRYIITPRLSARASYEASWYKAKFKNSALTELASQHRKFHVGILYGF